MERPWTIWQREQQHQAPVLPVPPWHRLVLQRTCNAAGWQNHLGVSLCSVGLFAWRQMSPTPVPGIRGQLSLQDFGLDMEGGVGKCSSGGGGPSQSKVSLNPQKFRSWHLFNHPLIPYSCCELIIVCKSENTQRAYLLKEWNNFPF